MGAVPKDLQVPLSRGPWSYRWFVNGLDATRFHRRLEHETPQPLQLEVPHVGPRGELRRFLAGLLPPDHRRLIPIS